MKTFRLITVMILVVGLIGVFSAFGAEQTTQGKKEDSLTESQKSKDKQKDTTPGSTAIQAPAANLQSLPLTITRLYLKDGKLRVVIKRQGSDRLSDEDYATTKLKVAASTLIKPLEWTLLEVDPQKRLNRLRREKDFDTGLAVTERTRVTATLYRGLWKTAKEGTLYPKMAKVDAKTPMGTPEKKDTSRTPTSIPADQPASADTSDSQPGPGFTDSGSSAPSTRRIQVIEPNGGEFWEECSLGTVRWHYYGPSSELPDFWHILVLQGETLVHRISWIPSYECCDEVRDPRETYYECTRSLAGLCIPEGGYKVGVCDVDWGIIPNDKSDNTFHIEKSTGTSKTDVRIRGFRVSGRYSDIVIDHHPTILTGTELNVSIDVEAHPHHGLEIVEISFRGHTIFHVEDPDDTYRAELELDISDWVTESGTYRLTAYAEDGGGNFDTHTLFVTLDFDEPTLTINSPREGEVFYADPISGTAVVTIDASAHDEQTGIFSITIPSDFVRTSDPYNCYSDSCRLTLTMPIREYSGRVSASDLAFNGVSREITFSVRSAADRPAGTE
jgi:hypothetical protein